MSAGMGARREETFRRLMAAQGIALERPHVSFVFKWSSYRPDWYDPTQDVYYEVLGTAQRGAQLMPTFDLMDLMHPAVVLRAVSPDGKVWRPKQAEREDRLRALPYGEAVIARMRQENMRLVDLSRMLGLAGSYVSRVARQESVPKWVTDRLGAFAAGAEIPPRTARRDRIDGRSHACDIRCLDMMELYAEGLGTSRIAKVLGIQQSTVYKTLKTHHRVSIRPRSATRGKPRRTYDARAIEVAGRV